MNYTLPSDRRVCAVCGRFLDWDNGLWVHPFSSPEQRAGDHPVIPVLEHQLDPAQVIPRCDFCYADYPEWILPTAGISMLAINPDSTESLEQSLGDQWGACGQCAQCIERNDWSELIRRAVAGIEAIGGVKVDEGTRAMVNALFQAIRKTQVGGLRRIRDASEFDPGTP